MSTDSFLQEAVSLSIENITNGGGPFGAIIVRNGTIISRAGNSVTKDCDPTAHAEVNAIRAAGKALNSHDLSECELYSSCEPCPMCLSAIYWSGIKTVYFANSRIDAENAGFNDALIYEELALPDDKKQIKMSRIYIPDAIKAFKIWSELDSVIKY
jgi:tRNA(Arg) A34 adenosine deaminase TadA